MNNQLVTFSQLEIEIANECLDEEETAVLNRNTAHRYTRPGPFSVVVNDETEALLRKLGKLPAEQEGLFEFGVGTGTYPG